MVIVVRVVSAWNNYLPNPAFVEMYECADGSEFDWEKYCPGWYSDDSPGKGWLFFCVTDFNPVKESGEQLKQLLNYQALYNIMVSYGAI